MSTILFATDFATRSRRAEDEARRYAEALQARVIILHVIEPINDDGGSAEVREFYASLETRAAEELALVEERFAAVGVKCETRSMIGPRWLTITDLAEEEGVSLVVIGTHHVVREGRPYIGTVSHKVFFACKRPLLVVPS